MPEKLGEQLGDSRFLNPTRHSSADTARTETPCFWAETWINACLGSAGAWYCAGPKGAAAWGCSEQDGAPAGSCHQAVAQAGWLEPDEKGHPIRRLEAHGFLRGSSQPSSVLQMPVTPLKSPAYNKGLTSCDFSLKLGAK